MYGTFEWEHLPKQHVHRNVVRDLYTHLDRNSCWSPQHIHKMLMQIMVSVAVVWTAHPVSSASLYWRVWPEVVAPSSAPFINQVPGSLRCLIICSLWLRGNVSTRVVFRGWYPFCPQWDLSVQAITIQLTMVSVWMGKCIYTGSRI